jgi:hypothetical protein
MFTVDTLIDTVQTAKKNAVNQYVKHEAIARSMHEFVDAQTAYTKSAVKAGSDAATKIAEELVRANEECIKSTKKAVEDFSKSDFVTPFFDMFGKDAFWNFAPNTKKSKA